MKTLAKHITDGVLDVGFISKSKDLSCALAILFFIFFAHSTADAQIHVVGGAKIVGSEQIYTDKKVKKEARDGVAVVYIIGGASVTNLDENVAVKKIEKSSSHTKVANKKSSHLKKALALQERVSQPQKVILSKKSTIHYKPFDNSESFLGVKHQYKTFNLPTEHPSKVLDTTVQQALILKDFSLEKIRILTAEFFNAHTFTSAFFTRPPPVKV